MAGQEWLDDYMKNLREDELQKVIVEENFRKNFRFADDKLLKSQGTVRIPVTLRFTQHSLRLDIVASKVPLLISVSSMKDVKMVLYAQTGTVPADGVDCRANYNSNTSQYPCIAQARRPGLGCAGNVPSYCRP